MELTERARLSRPQRTWRRLLRIGVAGRRFFSIAILLAIVGVSCAAASSEPAEAWEIQNYCRNMKIPLDTDEPDETFIAFGKVPDKNGNLPDTTWAQYGLAGIKWKPFWLPCTEWGSRFITAGSDTILFVSTTISATVITFFEWVFQGYIINVFVTPRSGAEAPLDAIVRALNISLVAQLTALMIVVGGLVLAWRSLIQGAGLADVLSKVLVMILIGALTSFYAENGAWIVKSFNDTTNDVTALTFAAFGQATCEMAPGQQGKCKADPNTGANEIACPDTRTDENGNPRTVTANSVSCIGQVMYNAMIYIPWANGLIGSLTPAKGKNGRKLTQEEFEEEYQRRSAIAVKVLVFQGFSRSEVQGEFNNDAKRYGAVDPVGLDKCVRGHGRAKQFQALMTTFDKNGDLQNWVSASTPDDFLCNFYAKGVEDPNGNWKDVLTRVDGDMMETFQYFSGNRSIPRLQAAVMALIGGLALSFVLFAVGIAYLVLQIATVAFAMIAPLAMLLGLIPVFGLRVFLKWAELFLGTFLKRLGLGVFVGLLMALYTAILLMPFDWLAQLAVVVVLALVGLVYRRKIFDIAGLSGVNQGLSMATTATRRAGWGVTKGAFKGTAKGISGFRYHRQRYLGAYESTGGMIDGKGREVGDVRRRLRAMREFAGRKPGAFQQQLDLEKRAGYGKGNARGQSKGWATDADGIANRQESVAEREEFLNDIADRRDSGVKGIKVRRHREFQRMAERGRTVSTRRREIVRDEHGTPMRNADGTYQTRETQIDRIDYKKKTRTTRSVKAGEDVTRRRVRSAGRRTTRAEYTGDGVVKRNMPKARQERKSSLRRAEQRRRDRRRGGS